jgi:hypothetical protein
MTIAKAWDDYRRTLRLPAGGGVSKTRSSPERPSCLKSSSACRVRASASPKKSKPPSACAKEIDQYVDAQFA